MLAMQDVHRDGRSEKQFHERGGDATDTRKEVEHSGTNRRVEMQERLVAGLRATSTCGVTRPARRRGRRVQQLCTSSPCVGTGVVGTKTRVSAPSARGRSIEGRRCIRTRGHRKNGDEAGRHRQGRTFRAAWHVKRHARAHAAVLALAALASSLQREIRKRTSVT
jgi:hypothetical protein